MYINSSVYGICQSLSIWWPKFSKLSERFRFVSVPAAAPHPVPSLSAHWSDIITLINDTESIYRFVLFLDPFNLLLPHSANDTPSTPTSSSSAGAESYYLLSIVERNWNHFLSICLASLFITLWHETYHGHFYTVSAIIWILFLSTKNNNKGRRAFIQAIQFCTISAALPEFPFSSKSYFYPMPD